MDDEIAHKSDRMSVSRRNFLRTIGWGSIVAFLSGSLLAVVRYLFPKVSYEPSPSFKVQTPEDYEIGTVVVDKPHKVFIVREENIIYALIAVCTHLGCTPRWFPDEGIFKCPCHGSRFYKNGINFYGPAPRPLDRAFITLAPDGRILIDTSKKFSSDGRSYGEGYLGDWKDPRSYLEV
jgi:cytochrome b6-f complex iron-sulfur subunit